MQLHALETNCKIWNDGINLYGFIYSLIFFMKKYTSEIASESPFAVTACVEKGFY